MKKRLLTIFLVLIFATSYVSVAYAHDNQKKHDQDLMYVLFGTRGMILSGDEKVAFEIIANAAALAIDQFSPNDTLRWKEDTYNKLQEDLRKLGVPVLKHSFDELDLNDQVAGKNVTANSHREYTHYGWNYTKYPNKEFWQTRKQVLLHAVNWTLFHDGAALSWIPWLSDVLYAPSEQCEAFSAMVYYIHILGDHIEGDVPEKLTALEPLIQYASMSTPGIIAELKEQLRILFSSQSGSWTYAALMEEISALGIEAEWNCGTWWGAVDTVDKCASNQKFAEELLEILARYLPKLLKNESFFSSCFK